MQAPAEAWADSPAAADCLFGVPKSQKSPHLKNAVWQHADSDVQPPTLYKPGSFLIIIHWTAPRSYNSLSEIRSANTFPAVHRSLFPG